MSGMLQLFALFLHFLLIFSFLEFRTLLGSCAKEVMVGNEAEQEAFCMQLQALEMGRGR